jgi:hypothetical protein
LTLVFTVISEEFSSGAVTIASNRGIVRRVAPERLGLDFGAGVLVGGCCPIKTEGRLATSRVRSICAGNQYGVHLMIAGFIYTEYIRSTLHKIAYTPVLL